MQFTKAQEYIGEQTPYEEADIYTKTRACAARGAAIYGAEGICKFICDILSETYMTDI